MLVLDFFSQYSALCTPTVFEVCEMERTTKAINMFFVGYLAELRSDSASQYRLVWCKTTAMHEVNPLMTCS